MSCSGQDFREVVFVEAAERRLVLTPTQYARSIRRPRFSSRSQASSIRLLSLRAFSELVFSVVGQVFNLSGTGCNPVLLKTNSENALGSFP